MADNTAIVLFVVMKGTDAKPYAVRILLRHNFCWWRDAPSCPPTPGARARRAGTPGAASRRLLLERIDGQSAEELRVEICGFLRHDLTAKCNVANLFH
jgi:hypothetical protein